MIQNSSPKTIFVTGTGTGIGKTVVAAILAEALHGDYWKPVQAGYDDTTDSEWIRNVVSNNKTRIHPEVYKLKLAASPHLAAKDEKLKINLAVIKDARPVTENNLVIEGAGGLMVPLNDQEFVADLIQLLNVPVILVSLNQLGSINHSLLTAMACKQKNIRVLGWIFNSEYLNYEDDIVRWTGYPRIASVPFHANPGKDFVLAQAENIRKKITDLQW